MAAVAEWEREGNLSQTDNRPIYAVLLLVFGLFVVLAAFAAYVVGPGGRGARGGGDGDKIGVVEVNGVIMESKNVVELLRKAEEDEEVKAIIVRVNSPGGAVSPSQEIHREIRRIDGGYDERKREGVPVFASFSSVAASGGYYVGSAAREVYANPGTLTGSIGVIMSFMDMTRLYEWAKVRPDVIKSGEFKDMGSPHRGITDAERELFRTLAEGVHQQFIDDVLETRREKIKSRLEDIARGQVFSGKTAFELGLVDELASLWEAGRSIHERLGLEGEFELKFIRRSRRRGLLEIFERLGEVAAGLGTVGGERAVPMFLMP